MRLVDVDAAERLMSDTVQGDIRGYPYDDETWNTAFEWLDSQPSVGWIPVSERLPEDGTTLLVTHRVKNIDVMTETVTQVFYYRFNGVNKWIGRYADGIQYDLGSDVVAWMPLPEPYKEGV